MGIQAGSANAVRATFLFRQAVQGFASSTGAVASIAGLILGGALYASLGNRVFLISAMLIALAFGLSFMIPTKRT